MSYLEVLASACKIGTYVQPPEIASRLAHVLPPERIATLHFKRLSFNDVSRIAALISNKGDDKIAYSKYCVELLFSTVYIKTDDGTFQGFPKEDKDNIGKLLDESMINALVEEAERANFMWTYAKQRTVEFVGNS